MINRHAKTRLEKINLLKGLAAGKVSRYDLFDKDISSWYFKGGDTDIKRKELEDCMRANPRRHYIIWALQEGNEPLRQDRQ